MKSYLIRRMFYLLPVLLGVSILAFLLANIAPGDPAELALRRGGQEPSPESIAALRQQLGLDLPGPVRYLKWLSQVLQGDLGQSYQTRQPVFKEIVNHFPATLNLAVLSMLMALLVALPLGVLSAVWPNSWLDQVGRTLALLFTALPTFGLSLLLIYFFAVNLKWLPTSGAESPTHIILPALALSLHSAGSLMRLTRAELLEVLSKDYLRTARSKGLPNRLVLTRHALKNALLPVVTMAGISFGHLLGGAAIVETIFAWPGIGKLTVDAIFSRDYPMVQGFVLLSGVFFVLINLQVDLLYRYLDPRLRLGATND